MVGQIEDILPQLSRYGRQERRSTTGISSEYKQWLCDSLYISVSFLPSIELVCDGAEHPHFGFSRENRHFLGVNRAHDIPEFLGHCGMG
jgi:hypothetical protein